MGLLVPLVWCAMLIAVPLLTLVLLGLLGLGLMGLWRRLQGFWCRLPSPRKEGKRQRMQRHAGPTTPQDPLPPGWRWLLLVAVIASGVWAFIVLPSDVPEFKHAAGKLFTYPSTRINLWLREDSASAQQRLITALTPLMQNGGRKIVQTHSSRHGRFTSVEEIPSYYRFKDGQMQIAMGGEMSSDLLAALAAGLEAFDTLPSLPERVPARINVGGQTIAVELLPHSTVLFAPPAWPLLQDAPTDNCHVRMQALFYSDAFQMLFVGGYRDVADKAFGQVQADVEWLASTRGYELLGLGLVAGDNGRPVKALATDATRIYGVLRMRPPGFEASRHVDCGRALLQATDPRLVAASTGAALADLVGVVEDAEVQRRDRFSPWYAGDGWEAVMPDGHGQVRDEPCDYEYRLYMRTRTAQIMAECARDSNGAGCDHWSLLIEDAKGALRTCHRTARSRA